MTLLDNKENIREFKVISKITPWHFSFISLNGIKDFINSSHKSHLPLEKFVWWLFFSQLKIFILF